MTLSSSGHPAERIHVRVGSDNDGVVLGQSTKAHHAFHHLSLKRASQSQAISTFRIMVGGFCDTAF